MSLTDTLGIAPIRGRGVEKEITRASKNNPIKWADLSNL